MRKRILAFVIAVATLAFSSGIAAAGNRTELANIVGQGLAGPTVAVNGGAIQRTPNGVNALVSLATPMPGSYTYPVGPTGSGIAGHPEVYSLWVFVFFNPEECAASICGPADLINDPDVVAGAFNAGGHVAGGSQLTIAGSVNHRSPTFGGPLAETLGMAFSMGYDLADAEIHLAIAPHGALAPELLPESIGTPVGNPSHWWLSIFFAVSD